MNNLLRPRILIVKLSAIGDVVHTLPALNALRRYYPQAHITWLVEAAAADLLIGHHALDRVIISNRKQWARGLGKRNWQRHLRQIKAFVSEIRDTHYDMILDFQAALKGAVLIALSHGQRKIGFGPGMEHQEYSYLVLNERIPMVNMEIHALERGLLLLESIGVPRKEITYDLPIPENAHKKIKQLLNQLRNISERPLICINPMAKWKSKLWYIDRFAALADRLINDYRAAIYFTGNLGDRVVIDRILKSMHHRAVNLAGQTSLIELAALYENVACVITTDTGPMHIASAMQTPVVALFGPTAPWRTGPFGQVHRIIRSKNNCSPCFRRDCKDMKCMAQISTEQVYQAVTQILVEIKLIQHI